MFLYSSYLIDMDEESIGLHLRVNDPAFGPLPFQQLLQFAPLLPKARTSRRSVQLSIKHRERSVFASRKQNHTGEGGSYLR